MSFFNCKKTVAAVALATFLCLCLVANSQAAIVVTLEQVGGPAVAVPGQQTLVTMELKASGTGSPLPLDVVGFTTLFSWTSSDAAVTDLYNVNSSGTVLNQGSAASAVVSNTTGFLFANVVPSNALTNSGTANPTFERALNIDGDGTPVSLSDPLASVTIATVYFGVTADVLGTFNVSLVGDAAQNRGFVESGTFNYTSFTSSPATLQVVPEPSTMYSLFAVGLVTTGFQLRRRFRRKAA